MMMASSFRWRFSRILRVLAILALAGASALWVDDRVSRPSLMEFDPDRMGRLEASMWRSYYEHRWFSLAVDGLKVSRGEYGFSIWDGARSSLLAARAARHFRGDTEDPRCLPLLERYYEILAEGLGRPFDVREAARLELEWWKERRRKLGPESYGRTVAANVAVVYALPVEAMLPGALARAGAMDYRDRHGRRGEMTAEHWDEVARRLTRAYRLLRSAALEAAVTGP